MANKRRTYTREFKLAAVKLITEQDYSVAEAARRLGISANLLHVWKKALHGAGDRAFSGQGQLPPLEAEVRRLRAENNPSCSRAGQLRVPQAFVERRNQVPQRRNRRRH